MWILILLLIIKDNVIVVTNVEFSETFFLPLLFENKKRSGGGDITSVYYDEKLKQFLIAFNSNDGKFN